MRVIRAVVLAALAVLPAIEAYAQSSQTPAFVSAACDAARRASAQGKAAANARVAGVGGAQSAAIASRKSCLESFGDSSSRAIVEIGGMDLSAIANIFLESACKVVVKQVNGAVDELTGVVGSGLTNNFPTNNFPTNNLPRIPANADEFYAAVANPANRGMEVPWPKDISGFPAATQAAIIRWKNQNLTGFDQLTTPNDSRWGTSGGEGGDGVVFDRLACTIFGRC